MSPLLHARLKQALLKHRLVDLEEGVLRTIYIDQGGDDVGLLALGRDEEVTHVWLKRQWLPALSCSLILVRTDITHTVFVIFFLPLVASSERDADVGMPKLLVKLGFVSQNALDYAPKSVLPLS